MATTATDLWITEDVEFEVALTRKNATSGRPEAASGLAGLTVHLSLTKGGAAIGACSWTPAERGTTGRYFVIADTATLVTELAAVATGTKIYEVWTKTGDVESRSWPRKIRRQREGDG